MSELMNAFSRRFGFFYRFYATLNARCYLTLVLAVSAIKHKTLLPETCEIDAKYNTVTGGGMAQFVCI